MWPGKLRLSIDAGLILARAQSGNMRDAPQRSGDGSYPAAGQGRGRGLGLARAQADEVARVREECRGRALAGRAGRQEGDSVDGCVRAAQPLHLLLARHLHAMQPGLCCPHLSPPHIIPYHRPLEVPAGRPC